MLLCSKYEVKVKNTDILTNYNITQRNQSTVTNKLCNMKFSSSVYRCMCQNKVFLYLGQKDFVKVYAGTSRKFASMLNMQFI